MKKRTATTETARYLDVNELAHYLSLGTTSAKKLGREARSVIRIGRRVLYDRAAIDAYMNDLRNFR